VRGFQGRERTSLGGYEPGRVLACAKHYIGYGAAEGGRDYNTAEISDTTLRNVYLPPFRAAVEAGAGSVMSSFQDLNGEAVSGSHYLLTELLREELGFGGFVVSDWNSIGELQDHRLAADRREAARLALDAGVDMDMCSGCYLEHVEALVEHGEVAPERLDEACRRILLAKFQLGLFEQPYTDPAQAARVQFTPEHQAAARALAARSMVLLKNAGVLPLRPGLRRVAVLGPFAQERRALLGSWVNDGLILETATLVEALRAALPETEIVTASGALSDEMLIRARWADLVVVAVGESNERNGEANCVASLDLPAGQEALVEAACGFGLPVVVVVFAGRPVTLTRIAAQAGALLYAWHPGTLGAAAAADVLTGAVNPSGRLPASFPRSEGQIPIHYNAKSTGRPWTQYLDMPSTPLYPFGFGLSYTRFAYDDVTVSPERIGAGQSVTVRARVTNTGDRAGEAVAQCYVQDCVASLTRPVRELKAFARVSLASGESVQVSFELGPEALAFYGPGGTRRVEPGAFKVGVGDDSRAELPATFYLD
jgi:beta-glucosidase